MFALARRAATISLSTTFKHFKCGNNNNNNYVFNNHQHVLNPFVTTTATSLMFNPSSQQRRYYVKKSKKASKKGVEEEEEEKENKKENAKAEKAKKNAAPSNPQALKDELIKKFSQNHGEGSLMSFGDASAQKIESIPTGSLSLDVALGVGGVPRGRVTEIFGPESSGKTTLAIHIIAEAQKRGELCTFIDAEHAFNPQWAQKLGVDLNQLLISQPDSGEQALQIAESLIESNTQGVVVIDSVSALVPRQELDGEMGDPQMALQARLMSQALRKIGAVLSKSKTALIFINQIRMKLGVMFGSPETTSGGLALRFYSSVRLDIRRIGTIKKGDEVMGSQIKVKVVKNKVAAPHREALFDIDFVKGISKSGEILDLGVKFNILEKSGTWFGYKGTNLAQGREKTKQHLEANPTLMADIEAQIREKIIDLAPEVTEENLDDEEMAIEEDEVVEKEEE